MSRRKQTNPRAIKRDAFQDEDENSNPTAKKFATESIRSDSIDSTITTEDEQKDSSIKCDTCQEIFTTSEQFNQHRLYQCSFLTEETGSDDSRTSSFDEYANQMDIVPYGTSQTEDYPHQCSYCNKSYSNMALLLKHEQIHVELMPFRCSFCGKGFKHRRSLNRHSKLHTGERKFKCTLCESTFARSDHLKAHIRTHNNNNNNNNLITIDKPINLDFQLKIPLNPKNDFEERSISSDSKLTKDDSKTEHCPYCPRICLGEDSLRIHIQNEHNQNLDEQSNNEQLKSERISPLETDTYCHLCNAKFNNQENYYAHIRCTHPPFQKTLEQTSLFQIPSIKPNLLKQQHQEKSDDLVLNEYALIEKSVWCEKCKRSFDSMTSYLQHYSFQHCLQIIKCLQCQDVFETLDAFFNHIERIHPSKTVETFKCKLCNATYKHRSDFLHHVQTVHKSSSVSPSYQCSLCPCQFNSTNELMDHLKFIHKINNNQEFHLNHRRPSFNTLFPCAFCSIKFVSRFELNQHILHEHNNEERRDGKSDWHQNGKKSTTPSSSDIICSLCDLTFTSESLLLEHNKHAHRPPPPPPPVSSLSPSFKCTYCYALFTSRTQLDRHSRIHIASSGNNLKCNICDRLFSTIDILSEHKLSHCKATTSNICSYCYQTLNNEGDYTRHLYEHNHHQQHHSKSKTKLFTNNNDNIPLAIACIVCKQSLINEREIDLHAKFHLANFFNKKSTTKEPTMTITCNQCHRITTTNRDFLLELPSFTINCFDCIEKDLKSTEPRTIPEIDPTSSSLSCPKCRHDVQFDSIKTYQQHFTAVHLSKHSDEEYHCLKCNKNVALREHIFQHQNKKSSSSSGFLIDSVDSSITSRCHSPPRVHYCYLCRTNFDTAIKMHIHLIEHQFPNHDYKCSLCEHYSFDDATQLYHHMVQHGSKARLHPCRECDVYFMFSMHLINHQCSHEDETLLSSAPKTNGNSKSSRLSIKSKFINNEDIKQSNDDEDISCKSIVTRSSTKGTCRSVIVT